MVDLLVVAFKAIWGHSQQRHCQVELEVLHRLEVAVGIVYS